MFVPKCFKKDLSNLSQIIKVRTNNEKVLKEEISITLEAKNVYSILKNIEKSVLKSQHIEYSKRRLKIKSAEKFFKISNSSDLYYIKLIGKILNFYKYEKQYKVLRFYSFSNINNCYFFLYRVVDEHNDKKKICSGGVVIPLLEKKILVFMKRGKKLSSVKHRFIFDQLNENLRILFEVMGKFVPTKELDRLSTVETLDPETDSFSIQKFENESKAKSSLFEIPLNSEIIIHNKNYVNNICKSSSEENEDFSEEEYESESSIISFEGKGKS